jgi:hypothetical protein
MFLCYRHAAKQMIKQGRGGRIIGATSSAGKQGNYSAGFQLTRATHLVIGIANLGHYSASKFAVRGLTQAAGEAEKSDYSIFFNLFATYSARVGFPQDYRELLCTKYVSSYSRLYVSLIRSLLGTVETPMSKVSFINGSSRSNAKVLLVDNFINQVGIPKDAFYAGVSNIQIMMRKYATDFLKHQQSQATAVGYHGQPEYIASLVSFFVSEGSHHITGKPLLTTLPEISLNIFQVRV